LTASVAQPQADPASGERRRAVAFAVVAAIVRLAYLIAAKPPFRLYYWDAADSLLRHGSLSLDGARTAALEPLYPIFLAAIRFAVGDHPLRVQAVQALAASAGAAYLYLLALTLTRDRRTAAIAAGSFAVYPLLVRHAVDGTESALLTTILIAFACRFVSMRSVRGAAAAGAWLGLAILTRTVTLPLLLLAPIVAARRNVREALALAAAAMVVLSPAAFRNYALSGIVMPSRVGVNLFIATNEFAGSVMPQYGPDVLVPYAESTLAARGIADAPPTPLGEAEQDAAFRRLAVAEIEAHPLDTAWVRLRNVLYFFSPVLVPYRSVSAATTIQLGARGVATVEHGVARPWAIRVLYSISYSLMFVLAVTGVYWRRHALRADAVLWCVLITFVAVYSVFFPATRYRAPVEFVLLFYAAVGAANVAAPAGRPGRS
jgi:hypothetical protein